MAAKAKPVEEVRCWPVEAAIWKNQTAKGTFYNVTFSRSYKDGEDYKSSDSFGVDDLLKLAEVARAAFWKIQKLEARDYQATSGTE